MITPSFVRPGPVDPTTPESALASPSSEPKTGSGSAPTGASDFKTMFSRKMAGEKHPHSPANPKNSLKTASGQATNASAEKVSKNSEKSNISENDNDIVVVGSDGQEASSSSSMAEIATSNPQAGSPSIPEFLLAMLAGQTIPPYNQSLPTCSEAGTSPGENGINSQSNLPEQTSLEGLGMAISLPTGFKAAPSGPSQSSLLIGKDVPAGSGQPEKIAANNSVPTPPVPAQISSKENSSKGEFSLPPELQDGLITKALEVPEPPPSSKSKIASNKASVSHVLSGGTGVALKASDMKATVEKNEIAGLNLPKEQNLSSWQGASRSWVDVSKQGDEQEAGDFTAEKKNAADQPFTANLPGMVELHSTTRTSEEESLRPATHAQQAEHISNLISQEVVSMKKLGASSLAVSLKVDNQTELSLRLNNHEGRIHAFVSCESGSVPHLEKHWQELQESLARQNVQLMPLNEKFSSSTTNYNASSNSNQSNQFEDHAQKNPQPRRDVQEEVGPAFKGAASAQKKPVKSEILQPSGWEIYA